MPKSVLGVALLAMLIASLHGGAATGPQRATLHGTVTDAGGKPVKHATVLVYYAGVKQGYSVFCATCYLDCGRRTATDAQGNFTISGLDPQLWFILLVAHDQYGSVFTKKLDPAEHLRVSAVLTLSPPISDPQRIVCGRVVDAGVRPCATQ